jgi:hypothetical protein
MEKHLGSFISSFVDYFLTKRSILTGLNQKGNRTLSRQKIVTKVLG